MFPTPLAILIFLAPESPWWLVRKGRLEAAAKSVARLGTKGMVNPGETVAMMRRVIDMETTVKAPSTLELFKGTDLRRTLIVCGVYLAQNLTGKLDCSMRTRTRQTNPSHRKLDRQPGRVLLQAIRCFR
jgi:SP family general alpha glucoside:H+ symporter-like MFS transporter